MLFFVIKELTEEEKQVYINENKEVPSYKSDSSTLEHFGKMGFLKALNYIQEKYNIPGN